MICAVCKQPINKNEPRCYYYKTNKDGSRSKVKTYEHSRCANLLPMEA